MRRNLLGKLLIVIALTLVSLVIVQQFFGASGSPARDETKNDKTDPLLAEIAKYRQWTLVNPTPVMMNPAAAAACGIAFPINPHETNYVSVYVNTKGNSAMMTEIHPRFPEGSIIVKEKLSDKLNKKPTALTVMVKREQGYNPASRDWEYLLLDGEASQIVERGKLTQCNQCHKVYVDTDFVTMRYLNWKPGVE